jgi:recombination protein RecA
MNKQDALNNALSMIEKQFGKGSIMKLGDKDGGMNVETSSSGSLSLDIALGG